MKKVLVVVDMQNDFIDGVLGSSEAQGIVNNVVDKINNFDGNIYVTKDTHQGNYLNTQEGKNLPVAHCMEYSDGWMLNDDIEIALDNSSNNYELYEKETFGSTYLAVDLRDEEIDEIELVGVCTDICVISNALLLKAFMPEVKITVDARCCAGVTPESHKTSLSAMKMCQINVINEEV